MKRPFWLRTWHQPVLVWRLPGSSRRGPPPAAEVEPLWHRFRRPHELFVAVDNVGHQLWGRRADGLIAGSDFSIVGQLVVAEGIIDFGVSLAVDIDPGGTQRPDVAFDFDVVADNVDGVSVVFWYGFKRQLGLGYEPRSTSQHLVMMCEIDSVSLIEEKQQWTSWEQFGWPTRRVASMGLSHGTAKLRFDAGFNVSNQSKWVRRSYFVGIFSTPPYGHVIFRLKKLRTLSTGK